MTTLPNPEFGDAAGWVDRHLGHLVHPGTVASSAIRGGQRAADVALAGYDVTRYASRRNEVWPESRRGASRLSPYIRHGLITLPEAWEHVRGGPAKDVQKFRDELLWQEYARHVYARLGRRTSQPLRHLPPRSDPWQEPWDRSMACVDLAVGELIDDGWLVNQTRMWMSSQWTVRGGADWADGEDEFFRHLLDGSRAANRLGWQWTVGTGTGRPYGFSRWQVDKRAPGLCQGCVHRDGCPIDDRPDPQPGPQVTEPLLRSDPDPTATAGPGKVLVSGPPDAVWLTAESLGSSDPASVANPELPAVFVFDGPLLQRLSLSANRLVFLTECLADLAATRDLEIHLGRPADVLADRRVAVTFAPVPGFRRLEDALGGSIAELHPWPWLRRPHGGPIGSFSAWRKRAR